VQAIIHVCGQYVLHVERLGSESLPSLGLFSDLTQACATIAAHSKPRRVHRNENYFLATARTVADTNRELVSTWFGAVGYSYTNGLTTFEEAGLSTLGEFVYFTDSNLLQILDAEAFMGAWLWHHGCPPATEATGASGATGATVTTGATDATGATGATSATHAPGAPRAPAPYVYYVDQQRNLAFAIEPVFDNSAGMMVPGCGVPLS
jgi:hypothetical protein